MTPGLIPSAGRNCEFRHHQTAPTANGLTILQTQGLRDSLASYKRAPAGIPDRQIVAIHNWSRTSGTHLLMVVARNPVRAARNHPLAALKWNHNLAETAIGWS